MAAVLDEKGQPVEGQAVGLFVTTSYGKPIATKQTDAAGGFQFEAVPANVPLTFSVIGNGLTPPPYFIRHGDRTFQPGETRENDEVRASRVQSPASNPRPSPPLADRVAETCRDVRACGMHAYVVLQADESKNAVRLTNQLIDHDQVPAALSYLPLHLPPAELKTEAATLKKYGWPIPRRARSRSWR